MKEFVSALEAAAYAAKFSGVRLFPECPPVNIGRYLRKITKKDEIEIFEVESQSAALSAAIGALAANKRPFVALSGPYNTAEIKRASFMRLPLVCVHVSRSSGAMTLNSDQNDFFSLRDSGCIMFSPESNQEILDSVLQAYMVCESVLLPAVVNIDGIANLHETVFLPTESAKRMLPDLKLKTLAKEPVQMGIPIEENYASFVGQQQAAMNSAIKALGKSGDEIKQKLKRSYGFVEKFLVDDADYVLVANGYHSSTIKSAVRKLREQGEKVGFLRIRVIRPWPVWELAALDGKKVAVIDNAVSLGYGGLLHSEMKGDYHNFIALNYLREKEVFDIFKRLKGTAEKKVWVI